MSEPHDPETPETNDELSDVEKERLRQAARDRLIDAYDVDSDDVDVDDGCAVVPAGVRGAAWAQVWVYVPAADSDEHDR